MSARRLMLVGGALIGALALSACGDKPQGMGGVKSDQPPYTGTGKAYQQPGWKAGDQKSWESQLRARAQNGQNEYNKTQ